MLQLQNLIFAIGIFASALAANFANAEDIELSPDGGSKKPGFVYVEPANVLVQRDGEEVLPPYLDRRHVWGTMITLGYSTYEPLKYEPNFAAGNFGTIYHQAAVNLLSLTLDVKRNFELGSIAGEFTISTYKNNSAVDPNIVDSTLTIYPIKIGAAYYADSLSKDPLFVPYVAGGVYTIFYNESQASASRNGRTNFAPWGTLGLQVSLNWVDGKAARDAFESAGLQGTYFFLEAQKFIASGSATDPDFSNDVSLGTGLRIEF